MNLNKIEIIDNTKIKAEAGTLLSKISNFALKNELSGIEFANGIPGTLGGAIKMNAGAYGGEIKDILETTTYLDENLQIHTISNKENKFEYRKSRFSNKNKDIILEATFNLQESNKNIIQEKMKKNLELRMQKQPINMPSAGSSFKRGNDFITAELIDKCDLKGYNVGDAFVSTKHAGFIVNNGNATASDVLKLTEIIRQKIYKKFNKKIELEFEVMGEDK